MINFLSVKVPEFIYEYVDRFLLRKKFERQVQKLRSWIFDTWLHLEKIPCKSGIFFYSIRIDIHYRAYLRKENGVFIVFDINKHDYESIKKKLKNL